MQSRGADPSIRTDNFDPYLNPGKHLPVAVATDDDAVRAKLLALEEKYAGVPKVRMWVPGWWWLGCRGMGGRGGGWGQAAGSERGRYR